MERLNANSKHTGDCRCLQMPRIGYLVTTWDHKPENSHSEIVMSFYYSLATGKLVEHNILILMTLYLTSCLWPTSCRSCIVGGALMSFWLINRSLDPLDSKSPFHAIAPTRAVWPCIVVTCFPAAASQTWTNPAWVPTATKLPCKQKVTSVNTSICCTHLIVLKFIFYRYTLSFQATEVTVSSDWARSHNLVTCEVHADHK